MNQRLPILFTFRRCPYAMRARMAIRIAEIPVEQIEVSLKNKPQELLDHSPKGTVPVVVTADQKVIDQSRDIMMWALRISDPHDWLFSENKSKQYEMELLVDKCDAEFKPLLDRYKYYDRYPEFSQEHYRRNAEIFLHELDLALAKHAYLIDDNMRFADVAIFPFIRQFAGVDAQWFEQSPYKNVQTWLHTCVTSELFESIMKK